jgi:hypothetical protein
MKACFVAKNPKWNCKKWLRETNIKNLPEKLWKRKNGEK